MSHFSVLVATQSPADISAALQPYHEYECTGVLDQYVRFCAADESLEELQKQHHEHLASDSSTKLEDFGQWVKEYHGYILKNGSWGRMTNPDKKWDWWVVGGRWSNSLLLKSGEQADQARKGDVDIAEMIRRGEQKAAADHDKAFTLTKGERWKPWDEIREQAKPIDAAREAYHAQPAVKALSGAFSFGFIHDDLLLPRETYITQKGKRSAAEFALLHAGKWSECGEMGWFACVSGDKGNDWADEYLALFAAIPDDWWVTVVDCHI